MKDDLDEAVNDILAQLKTTVNIPRPAEEDEVLTKEKLEEFIIKNSGRLVTKSLSLVDTIKEAVESAGTPEDVEALASLIKAASSAVEALNRLHIADERNKTQVKTKQMEVDSRERLGVMDNQTRMLLSREEIMKALITGEVTVPEEGVTVIDV